jgi:hypothetical protein
MSNPPSGTTPKSKNRTWIVFFLMLTFLAGLGIGVPLYYNLSIQLTAQQVADAKELWRSTGPADYDLQYMTKIDDDDPVEHRVAVRSGRVLWVSSRNRVVLSQELHDALGPVLGCPLSFCYQGLAPADDLTKQHSIDAFFALIESKMRDNVAVGGKNYATATFDLKYGYPLRYIHRVRGSHDRVELNVRLLGADETVEPRSH